MDSEIARTGGNEQRRPRSWALKAALGMIILALAAGVYVVFMAVSKPEPEGLDRYATGSLKKLDVSKTTTLSSRELLGPDDMPASLTDFKGRVTLVNIWATWCAPCIAEMPTLAALRKAAPDQDLAIVPVSIDKPASRDKARAMLKRLAGEALPFYQEPTMGLAFDMKAPGVPTTVLYDRSGREIARLAGEADWSSPEAQALIQAALDAPRR